MDEQFFSIVCDKGSIRLDQFLSDKMDGFSRTRIQALIKDGLITVSGKVKKPSWRLSVGDIIEGETPPCEELLVMPANIPLNIFYEDEQVIIINKPKNMVVHPAPGHFNDSLVNALLYHFDGRLSGINGVLRPGIVHRIDKDTTGLLMVAKTNEAHLSLSEQLSEHKAERIYEALVFGEIDPDEGTIDAPIGRHPKNRIKMSVTFNGKKAVTHYKVIERFNKYTHIKAILETGRTHQIRAHMAHAGYPLLGDTLYTTRKQPFKTEGQVLHAKTIGFVHPKTNEFMRFDSQLPQYFSDILTKLRGFK